jgi:hypothetical protein
MRTSNIQAALDACQRLSVEQLAQLLTDHRLGDSQAAGRLRAALEYLVWQQLIRHQPSPWITREDLLGTLYEDLDKQIRSLLKNEVTAVQLEGYVVGELLHSADHYSAEISESIRPRKPIKRTRRNPHSPRRGADDQDFLDVLEDPLAPLPLETPGGQLYRVPSRFEQPFPDNEAAEIEAAEIEAAECKAEHDRLLPFARNSTERAVLSVSCGGDLSDDLDGLTHAQARRILERLRRRAA